MAQTTTPRHFPFVSTFHPLHIALKALRELGPLQLGLYAWYQLGLRTGYLRWRTSDKRMPGQDTDSQFALWLAFSALPDRAALAAAFGENAMQCLLTEAEEILAGQVRLFGAEPRPLQLVVPGSLRHWTEYELGNKGAMQWKESDIKFIWQPGRFGWAFTLSRAYHSSGDERFAEAFWRYTETFLDANPPNVGPHWASAQEVALRLIALVFAVQVFATSPHSTPERLKSLGKAIASHATRIPPTLAYSRSQNNNHLLTESAGLITAGSVLPNHPAAAGWLKLGWHWFARALNAQIAADGSYVQHSTNYHRLMLQIALWVYGMRQRTDGKRQIARSQRRIEESAISNLQSAVRWLFALLDVETGRVPNLGPNDGAYILPLTVCPFEDYRPVLQAAALAFLGERAFPAGPWDEMALWLCASRSKKEETVRCAESEPSLLQRIRDFESKTAPSYPILRIPSIHSWASLRAVQFRSRPGHADQLHVDLWWRGMNVAQDAGTYLYNAPPPWDNALARTEVHNTLTVNSRDQMTRAGRFLWLDWAQGQILSREQAKDGSWERLTAQHLGYRCFGLIHRRAVTAFREGRWLIEDCVLPDPEYTSRNRRSKKHHPQFAIRLHWLLPDWLWQLQEGEDAAEMILQSPAGLLRLCIRVTSQAKIQNLRSQITRGGQLLHGSGLASPTRGWVSPTYGCKIPALSFAVEAEGLPPMILISEWQFPEGE